MNASRLRELVDLLLNREEQHRVQQIIGELHQVLGQVVSSPQDPNLQNQFSQVLAKLNAAASAVRTSFEPAQIPLFVEIGADKYFIDDFAAELSASIRENPLSPAVTQQKLKNFLNERQNYINPAFEALQKIVPQLAFPKMEGAPILKLPQPPPAPDPRNE
jgi:hypothetical protein